MPNFLSCDWGTSSFRLKLIDSSDLKILAEEKSNIGIRSTYSSWCETGETGSVERQNFYLSIILEYIRRIEKALDSSLDGIPLIISGMASSSIGIKHLPYSELPFNIDGSGIKTAKLDLTETFKNPVLLISGVKSENDVMRGEETQLIGSVPDNPDPGKERLFIFPGTHSKHIQLIGKEVVGFKTYMTGEFFELLSEKSILKAGLQENSKFDTEAFQLGVKDAVGSNLLNSAFRVRTNELLGKFTKDKNYHYLSGLLIGSELKEARNASAAKILLCCHSNLQHLYTSAIKVLELHENVHIFPAQWVDESVVRGQIKVYRQSGNL